MRELRAGLGQHRAVVLWEIIRGFQYAETCAVMIIIVVSVSAIDLVSARIRKVLVQQGLPTLVK